VILCDVNVFVYAHRRDVSPDFAGYSNWLRELAEGPAAFALSEEVLAGFTRVVTDPRIFADPTPTEKALRFCRELRARPNAIVVRPGSRNWEIFSGLCREVGAGGNLVADARHAALAIEHACEWVTADRDYAIFPRLKWRHPFGEGAA